MALAWDAPLLVLSPCLTAQSPDPLHRCRSSAHACVDPLSSAHTHTHSHTHTHTYTHHAHLSTPALGRASFRSLMSTAHATTPAPAHTRVQVAFKRIQDEVPMAIRRTLLRRLGDRQQLEAALRGELPDVAAGAWRGGAGCRYRPKLNGAQCAAGRWTPSCSRDQGP